jgi:uncharacterized protein Yka (UPF0111/DUF47 family)
MRYLLAFAALSLYSLLPGCMTSGYVNEVREEAREIELRMDQRFEVTAKRFSREIRSEAEEIRKTITELGQAIMDDVEEFNRRVTKLEELLKKYERLADMLEGYIPEEAGEESKD